MSSVVCQGGGRVSIETNGLDIAFPVYYEGGACTRASTASERLQRKPKAYDQFPLKVNWVIKG